RAAIAGTGAASFAVTHDECSGRAVAPGASCRVGITFSPGANGRASAQLQLFDDAPPSPQVATLTGTATDRGTLAGRVLHAGENAPVAKATLTLCDLP